MSLEPICCDLCYCNANTGIWCELKILHTLHATLPNYVNGPLELVQTGRKRDR